MDDRFIRGFKADGGTTEVPQYRAVVHSTSEGYVELPAAAGQKAAGITETNSARDGGHISVITKGRAKAEIASAVSQGDQLRANGTTGKLEKAAATLETSMTGANNDIALTAKGEWQGKDGALITLTLVDPSANSQSLAVTVSGFAISASLATDGSGDITTTASELIAAINAHATAGQMVTAALKGTDTGAGVVTALSATNLSGGFGAFCTAMVDGAADTEIIDVEVN